jgi:hypothetical protein
VADSADLELDDELRRQRFDLRLVQEEAELEGELATRRAMSLDEALVQWLVAGDIVEAISGTASVTGMVLGHSAEVATIEVDAGRFAEVAIAHLTALRMVSHGRPPDIPTTAGRTMRLALSDAEVHCYEVMVQVTTRTEPFSGRVRVVGMEHLELVDALGREWLIPLVAVEMVLRPESPGDAWADG